MKAFKLAIVIAFIALILSFSACTIDEPDYGLHIAWTLECTETEFPQDKALYRNSGKYDVLVQELFDTSQYLVSVAYENARESTKNDDFGQGEGNTLVMKRFNVSFDTPRGWKKIPSISVPCHQYMPPGTQVVERINIANRTVREAISNNYLNNAYKEYHKYAVMRPETRADCGYLTEGLVECPDGLNGGYKCEYEEADVDGDSDGEGGEDVQQQGRCYVSCGLKSEECKNGYVCDLGISDEGICRESCTPGVGSCTDYYAAEFSDGDEVKYTFVKPECKLGEDPEKDSCLRSDKEIICYSINDKAKYTQFMQQMGLAVSGDDYDCRNICDSDSDTGCLGSNFVSYLESNAECEGNKCIKIAAAPPEFVEFACVRGEVAAGVGGMCVPAANTVNPVEPVRIRAKIQAVAKDVSGDEIKSNTHIYDIHVCRGCLLNFGGDYWCNCTWYVAGASESCYTDNVEHICPDPVFELYQDYGVECTWIPACYELFCL